jgi:nucleotide-binding universal stress UspA family protein
MRVMLAVHLHEGAEELVSEAVRWAQRMQATLDLLFVDEYQYNLYLVDDPAVRTVLDEQWSKVHDEAQARLHALVAAVPEAIRGEALFVSGQAPHEVVQAGATHDAILIGTHGRTGVAHLLLGSVAERVVRTATVPVIVLPMGPRRATKQG